MQEPEQTCPICQGKNLAVVFRVNGWENWTRDKTYQIYRCKDCAIVFTEKSEDDMEKFYSNGLYKQTRNRFHFLVEFVQILFQLERLKKVKRVCISGKLLDIGCGKGRFLVHAARKGWDVYGVEPSLIGRNYSLSKGIRVFASLDDLKGKKFDVITLWHVLEHVDQPVDLLLKIKQSMDENTVLIISVPNFDSIQAKVTGTKWVHLDVPRHRIHYSPQTLENVLCLAGYRVLETDHLSLEFNVIGFFQSLLNLFFSEPGIIYRLIKREFNCKYGIIRCFLTMGMLVIVAALILPFSVLMTFLEY
ncbi:MAG: class I SAM-dependent methyltransferase, partial [Pseudothermotoga sp.]